MIFKGLRFMKTSLATFLIILVYFSSIYALETDTHEEINEYIARNTLNDFSLNSYLKNQLGLQGGINEIFNSQYVWKWLWEGGVKEDKPYWYMPYLRSVNHFHNPLTEQGFSGVWGTDFLLGQSSINWSHTSIGNQYPGGHYSWYDVRDYYYRALTVANKTDRETNFAETFRGLGQLMHLVEDVSVPEHTRDDGHYIFYNYEKWVNDTGNDGRNNVEIFPRTGIINIRNSDLQNYMNITPIFYDSFVLGNPNPIAPVPFANLFDTDQYNGTSPNVTLQNNIGLSEYTNANFLSPDSMFTASFPYPAWSGVIEHDEVTDINTGEKTTYLKKLGVAEGGNGESINHLAVGRWFYKYLPSNIKNTGLTFDDRVYSDYAQKLIPRAVGYSTGLLNYFFRGDIDFVRDDVTGTEYVIVNNTDEDMNGVFELYYDDISDGLRKLYWTGTFAIGRTIPENPNNNKSPNIPITLPSNASSYILVFRGTLGNEAGAVVGRVLGNTYFVVMPLDNSTRQTTGKNYYLYNGSLVSVQETDLPFTLIDDGGYWDSASSSWTATYSPESIGVPLSVGGPQYIAKYKDETNDTIRFIPNVSYEKNAYQDFHKTYSISGQMIKDFHYVVFKGSPLLSFGAYEENPGYMEYMEDPNNLGTYGIYSLRPLIASNPQDRFFNWYNSKNFIDTFLEYDAARFYRFDNTADVQAVPQDANAPFPSVTAVSRTGNTFNVKAPKIFNYTRPNPYWSGSSGYGSSGIDSYTASIGYSMSYNSSANKCSTENNNCGNVYQGSSSVNAVFDIPYNFNIFVRVHNNDNWQYYEELYIDGQLVESSSVSTGKLNTHYQILAVYKNNAVVRETNWISKTETGLPYMYKQILADDSSIINPRIYEIVQNFTSSYFVYVNGARYDLSGQTTIQSNILDIPHHADYSDNVSGLPLVEYLTFENADDITGYHIDRIFLSDSFDGNHILIAFDEYSYNNGEGLVHDLNYSASDNGNGKYFLYYDIKPNKLQGASHEALPDGRKILLFNSNGVLENSLQDPIGLNYLIGSIGILN